jgi:hypothetical protein
VKDRDFLLGAASQPGLRPGDPTWDEAVDLARRDREQLSKRLFRPSPAKRVRWRGLAHWSWWIEDEGTDTVHEGPHRAFTERGARRKADRALIAVRTEQLLSGAGSAGYAADSACQHGMPFAGRCKPCGRAGL